MEENRSRQRRYEAKIRIERPGYVLLKSARSRAGMLGLPFNLSEEDIVVPEICPVFGIKMDPLGKRTDLSPSLDRIVPEEGYVKGNIAVISWRANRLKNDATVMEMIMLARFYERITAKA